MLVQQMEAETKEHPQCLTWGSGWTMLTSNPSPGQTPARGAALGQGRARPAVLLPVERVPYTEGLVWTGKPSLLLGWPGLCSVTSPAAPIIHIHRHLQPHRQHAWLQEDNLGDSKWTGRKHSRYGFREFTDKQIKILVTLNY